MGLLRLVDYPRCYKITFLYLTIQAVFQKQTATSVSALLGHSPTENFVFSTNRESKIFQGLHAESGKNATLNAKSWSHAAWPKYPSPSKSYLELMNALILRSTIASKGRNPPQYIFKIPENSLPGEEKWTLKPFMDPLQQNGGKPLFEYANVPQQVSSSWQMEAKSFHVVVMSSTIDGTTNLSWEEVTDKKLDSFGSIGTRNDLHNKNSAANPAETILLESFEDKPLLDVSERENEGCTEATTYGSFKRRLEAAGIKENSCEFNDTKGKKKDGGNILKFPLVESCLPDYFLSKNIPEELSPFYSILSRINELFPKLLEHQGQTYYLCSLIEAMCNLAQIKGDAPERSKAASPVAAFPHIFFFFTSQCTAEANPTSYFQTLYLLLLEALNDDKFDVAVKDISHSLISNTLTQVQSSLSHTEDWYEANNNQMKPNSKQLEEAESILVLSFDSSDKYAACETKQFNSSNHNSPPKVFEFEESEKSFRNIRSTILEDSISLDILKNSFGAMQSKAQDSLADPSALVSNTLERMQMLQSDCIDEISFASDKYAGIPAPSPRTSVSLLLLLRTSLKQQGADRLKASNSLQEQFSKMICGTERFELLDNTCWELSSINAKILKTPPSFTGLEFILFLLLSPLVKAVFPAGESLAEASSLFLNSSIPLADSAKKRDLWYIPASPDFLTAGEVLVPNDPMFGLQWSLRSSNRYSLSIDQAWKLIYDGYTKKEQGILCTPLPPLSPINPRIAHKTGRVVVALIDSGCNLWHPDLQGSYWRNPGEFDCYDGVDEDGNGYIDDCHGWDFVDNLPIRRDFSDHGTAAAGLLASVPNNLVGITGACWDCEVMCIRAIKDNSTSKISALAILKAIDYALNNGAVISSNSWGTLRYSPELLVSIRRAQKKNHLFIAAAGNSSRDNDRTLKPFYPASYLLNNIISVGSSTFTGSRASFSNYGERSVDIFAPGVSLLAPTNENGYAARAGTSFSAPLVAGIAAMILSACPGMSYSMVKDIILTTATKTPELEGLCVTGGIANASEAVVKAKHLCASTKLGAFM